MVKIGGGVAASLRRDVIAGSIAGLVGGLVFWWALQAQDMVSTMPGLLGLKLSGAGVLLHLAVSIPLGVGLGAILRYQPLGYAATINSGLLYGLLWWIAGPITIGTVLDGRGLTWSVNEAGLAFPSLIGHLLYGSLAGSGFYILVSLYLHLRPEPEGVPAPGEVTKERVVILGSGFGGIGVVIGAGAGIAIGAAKSAQETE